MSLFKQVNRIFAQDDFWLAPIAAGVVTWMAFVIVGQTPMLRATAMSLAIVGVGAALRHFGALLTVVGALTLAFSPAYWSQTGGTESLAVTSTLIALAIAGVGVLIVWRFSSALPLGVGAGVAAFALLFWLQLSPERSLRLTTIFAAWLLFLLIDTLLRSHPHPEDEPKSGVSRYHVSGITLLLGIGIMNDPLLVLMMPAAVLTLILAKQRIPIWGWLLLAVIAGVGIWGITTTYAASGWWSFSAEQAEQLGIRVPFILADGWRYGVRWVGLMALVAAQFSVAGVALGVLGLARLARWYPPLGTTTLAIYAAYALFGLVYFGRNSHILLLPLLMMQVIWMTYAVHTLAQWLKKSQMAKEGLDRWLAPTLFALMPLFMFWQIISG